MNKTNNMLSIVTPVLNGSRYIINNIESIQKLTIPYEHIIVDGGSIDDTIEYVSKFPSVKLLRQKDKTGMYGAIHQGFLESKGEYITWVNADDMVISDGFAKLYLSAQNKNADLAYSHGIHHFVEKYYYKKHYARLSVRYLLKEGVFPFVQPSVIFTASAYEKIGGLNYEKFKLIGDRDLFQRMAYNKDLKFLYVPVFSSVFLRYENSLLYRNLERRKLEYKYCIKSNANLLNRFLYHISQMVRAIMSKVNIN
jgi:glycosyltransferase involved in cell wall biosynthesis